MFVRLNGRAAWWDAREFAIGDWDINLAVDFPGLPQNAHAVELDIRIEASTLGQLVMKDGDGAHADELNRFKPQSIVKAISQAGRVRFQVREKPVKFTNVGLVGYWN